MAIRDGNFIRGAVGNVVFRVLNGKQVMQSRVAKGAIKHSQETKKSSQTFGMASSLASDFRQTISRIKRVTDFAMASRLSGKLFSILSVQRDKETGLYRFEATSFKNLEGFNFNVKFPTLNRIHHLPVISRDEELLSVSFPDLGSTETLSFPYGSDRCKITVTVSLFRLADARMVDRCAVQERVLLRDLAPFEPFEFQYMVPDGCFYIVSLWLNYDAVANSGLKLSAQLRSSSGCICEAKIAEGAYNGTDGFFWSEMSESFQLAK